MDKNLIIGRYQITYHNGIVQKKNLIRHSDFVNVIKPIQDKIRDLKNDKKEDEAANLKNKIKQMIGEYWFTDQSLIYDAYKTGILSLPGTQGGEMPCKVEKL